MTEKILKWHKEYPFRIEKGDDVSLVTSDPIAPQSKLSPLTNLTLNVLTSDKSMANFIICFPSNTLKPIPLISYILAAQSKKSVLVFSKNNAHYKNYYLLKVRYARNWAYNKYPAGKIVKGEINIELHAPRAKRWYKDYFKARIPEFKRQFFNENYPKILFNLSKNIKFSDSIINLYLDNENIESSKERKLGISNIIFENIDYYVYSSHKFDSFAKWIEEFRDEGHRFIFHVSNPNYKLLDSLKNLFKAYILYFPYSFIKANEDLKKKNKIYFKSLNLLQERSALNLFNLDSYDIYSRNKLDHIIIENPLKKGNIDGFFERGIKLFEKINWKNIQMEIFPVINQLRYLYFSVYNMFCIPSEFGVKYYDKELEWRSFQIEYYLKIAYELFEKHSVAPTQDLLFTILMYLSKMVLELSECKRYDETISYSRKGKNYALCEFLAENLDKQIVIGVQSGEKGLIYEKIENFANDGRIIVATLRQIARSVKDFSDYTLILAGFLLPNHFQIYFKTWKEIRFFVYKGKNYRWVKKQIKLIDHIDIKKEEQSFKYLAEIYRNVLGVKDIPIEEIPLFKHFIEKKKRYLSTSINQEKDSNKVSQTNFLDKEVTVSSSSITEICRQIMKSNSAYKDIINAEKAKSIVKRYYKKSNQKYLENIERFDCVVKLENEISGSFQTVNLDVRKKYLYFTDTENVKIESCFPHFLKEDHYLILFGEREKLSISDFIKDAFELEEDIDYKLIDEWHGRLSSYYLANFSKYKSFYKRFKENTPSTISSVQFNNWVKGKTNYTLKPMNFYYLGELMRDDFFTDNFKLICEEGKKIQKFNQKLSRKIKKLVVRVLDHSVSRAECSPDELLLLENIENSIFKILNITIKK